MVYIFVMFFFGLFVYYNVVYYSISFIDVFKNFWYLLLEYIGWWYGFKKNLLEIDLGWNCFLIFV